MQDLTLEDITKRVCNFIARREEVMFAYLFGSMVTERNNPLSDIDIAIFIDEKIKSKQYPYGYKADILTELLSLLNTNQVDLVILNTAPILLRHRVIYYGQLIFSCHETKRIQFQVETIDKYNDLKMLLQVQQQYFLAGKD